MKDKDKSFAVTTESVEAAPAGLTEEELYYIQPVEEPKSTTEIQQLVRELEDLENREAELQQDVNKLLLEMERLDEEIKIQSERAQEVCSLYLQLEENYKKRYPIE